LADGWLTPPGWALDIGCGLGAEAAALSKAGFRAVGVDISSVALERASAAHHEVSFVEADVRCLPFADGEFEVLLDRGCFHYMQAPDLTPVREPGLSDAASRRALVAEGVPASGGCPK
jgi:ubiquinone/menaquinone biosynthesis C-methylase UbiE